MIESFDDKMPQIAKTAFVHPCAYVRGDVEIDDYSIILPGAAISADRCTIKIGKRTIVEENCVIHGGSFEDLYKNIRSLVEIGDDVTIGHGAVVHGKKIGNRTLIGMNATVLLEAEIDNECVIAAGSVVPGGMIVPYRSFVSGVPALIKGKLKESQMQWVQGGYAKEAYCVEYIKMLNATIAVSGI